MGEKLVEFFERAHRLGGIRAKVRLAALTKMPSTLAVVERDTPESVRAFELAMDSLQREFAGASDQRTTPMAPLERPGPPRRGLDVAIDLLSQRELFLWDRGETARRMTEAASLFVQVERASVWSIIEGGAALLCADLYERSTGKHSAGVVLRAEQHEAYFRALRTERVIAANDACGDSRTSSFAVEYLRPLGIASMLDVPVWGNGRMLGVVCCEHVGSHRAWSSEDENLAHLCAVMVGLSYEVAPR